MGIEEMMAPFAEHPCPNNCYQGEVDVNEGNRAPHGQMMSARPCEVCNGTGLDPRFDALRGEHDFDAVAKCHRCGLYEYKHLQNEQDEVVTSPYCPRTDLGALVRVAAACGLTITYLFGFPDGHRWQVNLGDSIEGVGDNPEDALALAIIGAVPL